MNASITKGKVLLKAFLLIFTIINIIYPQISDISFDHISLEDGLSQSIVKCILQDKNGFMYFGTEDGLNIYDAYAFTILRNSPRDPNSLSYNDITTLCEDNIGRLWIGTFNSGMNLYIPDKKEIIRFNFKLQNTNSLSNNNINAAVLDNKGNIWIGTDFGLNRINTSIKDSGFVIERGVMDSSRNALLEDVKVLSLLFDKHDVLWIGTTSGLFKVFKKGGSKFFTILNFKYELNNKNSLSNNTVRSIYEDTGGEIWVGTDKGLNKISLKERNSISPKFYKYFHSSANKKSISNDEIYAICEDLSGLIWIGTNGGGINIYNKKKDQFTSYRFDPLDDRSLSANEIRSLYLDRSGIMWIGTYGSGINKVSRKTGQFYHYKYRTNDSNSLSHSIIWSFYQDNDSILWIGTHNGLNRLDRKTNSYKHYVHLQNKNSLSNNVVRVITPIENGKLLLGTNGGGVDEFDTRTGRFNNWHHDPKNPNSLIYDEIRAIYKDKDGIIWIGTYGGGLDRFNPTTGLFKHYFNIPNDSKSLSQNYVRVIVEDNNGYLWIGTEGGGLNKFDKKNEKFIHYRARINSINSLQSDYIFSILIDPAGFLWLGTFGGGLNKFYLETGKCKIYTVNDGLCSNSIYGIVKDNKGNLWLSTNNGLSRFDPLKEKFKNYNVKDGLQDNEFNGGSYYKTKNGELLFGGINGFNAFYPVTIKDNNYIPPVVLTSFKVFNREINFSKPLTSIKEIELPYSDNIFSFEFAALDYFSPEKNKYAYKLEGVDKDWVYISADKRFAGYTLLSPGNYNFLVKGSNSDGVWNENGLKLFIRIIPPFWQRFWFIILISLVIICVAFLLYLRRLKIIRMKVELQTAHDAQLSIMPESDPINDNLDVSGICIPANEVGGDFFDYFQQGVDGKRFGIIIGDVSGKAMKAAVTAIMTSGMIMSEIRSQNSINKILDNVNSSLINKIEKRMFVSMCICVIDTENMKLSVANAGLTRPILLSGSKIEFLQSDGPRLPLGVKSDIHYKVSTYDIKKEDLIFLTTDGIDEAENANRELFGVERLKNHILSISANHLSVSEMKDSIIKEVQKFIKKNKSDDDMTVLVIKVK